MYTNLNMNDNNRKKGLGKKEMLEVKKCFICKTTSLKEFWIKFSRINFIALLSCNLTFLNEVVHWS